jgi:hypothetical protein
MPTSTGLALAWNWERVMGHAVLANMGQPSVRPQTRPAGTPGSGGFIVPPNRQRDLIMARNIFRTGKKTRPKTAVKGKRYRCARCRKRSPRPVKTPAPWYCPGCLSEKAGT